MSQSLLYHAFGVREGCHYVKTQYRDGCFRFVLAVRPDWIQCPVCGGKAAARKGPKFRELRALVRSGANKIQGWPNRRRVACP